ncbi:MAG: hypothetical protein JKY96_00685 [Phycisphaerales bacterium]|nr:hypothetical protein [Phycisphaerales bacterium]
MIGAGVVGALLPGGCRASGPAVRESRAWHGQTPVMGSYQFGRLTTDLPPGTPIESVMAVARAMLHRQGHVIEQYSISPQGGRLVALSGGGVAPYDKIKINTSFEGSTVVLVINLDPGNENRSRVVLETLLAQLGM